MAETEYFALLWDGDDVSRPRTVVRRRPTPEGTAEEILRADGAWDSTNVLMLAELNMYEKELRPISATAALEFERRIAARRSSEEGRA
ncbi:hypothetical protein [Cellulomonas sp. P5_C5]